MFRLLFVFAFTLYSVAVKAIIAFPGAEGFGQIASGGRGGTVYVVNSLNDSGNGTFRDAVSQSNRIVVFSVSGLITISSPISVKSNITIAGQTAPGQGISIYGDEVSYSNANNTITRYIRYRMGPNGTAGKDAVGIAAGANMIFDHVSASWGRDETFSINGPVSNVTISDCLIAQGLETHSAGGLIQTSGGVSILRTLYIDHQTRNPKVKGVNDFVNNVIYNWGKGGGYIEGDSAGASYTNIIGNVFISGPNTTIAPFTRGNENFHTYVSNNYWDNNTDGSFNGAYILQDTSGYTDVDFQTTRYPYPTVAVYFTPTQALSHVQSYAGASLSRDHVDHYLINSELGSLGIVGNLISDPSLSPISGPGPIITGTAPQDSDGDGIPDSWEIAHGLNPYNASDSRLISANGYANIENYVNSLVPVSPYQ